MDIMSLAIIAVITLLCLTRSSCDASFSTKPDEKEIVYSDSGILAAFGDINADTKTDVFLIDKTLKSFTIMKHTDEGSFESSILSFSQRCFMQEEIVSLIPADFRGETYVDVAVISRNPNPGDAYNIRVSRGNGPNGELDCSNLNMTANYSSSVQPLLLDYNGDMMADLLIESKSSERIILRGPYHSDSFSGSQPFLSDQHDPISDPHSNQFIDFNGDGVADIMIETATGKFEFWYADSKGHYGTATSTKGIRSPSKVVVRPSKIDGHTIEEYGQSVFMDIDGDARQEHLLPVNVQYDNEKRAAILIHREQDIAFKLIAGNFTPSNETQYLRFREEKYKPSSSVTGLTFPLAIRQGDVNGDGYPDIVSLMQAKDQSAPSIIILQNVADKSGDRTFVFMSKAPVTDPLVAAFMDLTESGTLDLMHSSRSNDGKDEIRLGGIMNVVAFESYFLKVMVASGNCPPGGCIQDHWDKKEIVDYGSNLPGAYITYSLQDVNGEKKLCGAGQMSSAAHFALQTPYLVMGLGEYANYVDVIRVTLPFNGTGPPRVREDEQIVPDAQIIIVPRSEDPRRWTVKMWLNINGNSIKHTGYTLYLIFCILLIIIIALHKKEVMEDADENKRFKQNWLDSR